MLSLSAKDIHTKTQIFMTQIHLVLDWKVFKGGFFQKVLFVFQISQSPKWKYSKLLSWAWNLNLLFTVVGGKFKFLVQDSDLECIFFGDLKNTLHFLKKKISSESGGHILTTHRISRPSYGLGNYILRTENKQ